MAIYRPKSLNEINNTYDKTITSRNVIKVNETAITAVSEQALPVTEAAAEDEILSAPVSTVGDLTEDIQKFIREFSNPEKAEERPIPRTTQIKPAAVKPQAPRVPEKEAEPAVKAEKRPEPPAEKPEFVITAEKSELFEEYMKIMSDEDDDSYFSKSRQKKKKKSKKYEELTQEEEQNSALSPAPDSELPSDDDSYQSFTAPEYISDLVEPERPVQTDFIPDEEDDEPEEAPIKEKKGRVALQLVLIISLLLTLVAALGTTLLNVVFKINTGETFSDKYYIYTVSKDDAVLNLTKGDLVVATEEAAAANDIVAYYNSDLKCFDFAVKRDEVGEDVTLAENEASNGRINIFNANIRGKLTKIYPSIGNIVGILSANFALVLAVLMAVALVLILVLAFAFGRGKKKDDDELTFYEDEAYESDF